MIEKINKIRELASNFRVTSHRVTFGPIIQLLFEEYEVSEDMDSYLTQYSYALAPVPLDVETMEKLTPYANPKKIKKSFAGAVSREWLEKTSEHSYLPTKKTNTFVKELCDRLSRGNEENQVLETEELKRLSELTYRIIETARTTEVFEDKERLEIERKFYSDEANDFYKVVLNISDLFVFRDVAHIDAWVAKKVDGYAWEAFSLIWEGEAQTAVEIVEKRPARGYSEKEYKHGLTELVERGWLKELGGKYELTEDGKALRQEAEDRTNENFNAAFSSLDENEIDEVINLISKLVAGLAPEAKTN